MTIPYSLTHTLTHSHTQNVQLSVLTDVVRRPPTLPGEYSSEVEADVDIGLQQSLLDVTLIDGEKSLLTNGDAAGGSGSRVSLSDSAYVEELEDVDADIDVESASVKDVSTVAPPSTDLLSGVRPYEADPVDSPVPLTLIGSPSQGPTSSQAAASVPQYSAEGDEGVGREIRVIPGKKPDITGNNAPPLQPLTADQMVVLRPEVSDSSIVLKWVNGIPNGSPIVGFEVYAAKVSENSMNDMENIEKMQQQVL